MKILVIPDIHGELYWKKAIDLVDKYDKIVFLGDYFDAWDDLGISNIEMLHNFNEIIYFKISNPDKVEVLYGNHELNYLSPYFRCSGFRPSAALMFKEAIIDAQKRELIQVAYQYDTYLFTHAGVTNGWFKTNKDQLIFDEEWNLAETLNNSFLTHNALIFGDVSAKRGGFAKYGSPIWADMQETATGGILKGINQIVGHTPLEKGLPRFYEFKSRDCSILFCDCKKLIELNLNSDKYNITVIVND